MYSSIKYKTFFEVLSDKKLEIIGQKAAFSYILRKITLSYLLLKNWKQGKTINE